MKKILASFLIITMAATACTKDEIVSNTDNTTGSALRRGSGENGTEDNANGGGGKNIAASKVPSAVMAEFTKRYPDATKAEWKKLSNGNYKVEFNRGTVRWESIFTPAGTLLKQERDRS